MPELPEVETIKKGLEKYLVGHRVGKIKIVDKKILKEGKPSAVAGAKVTSVERKGKVLIINLDNGYSVVVHIKLTGQLIYQGPQVPKNIKPSEKLVAPSLPDKHTHVIFYLDKKGILYYRDFRRFGWIRIVHTQDIGDLKFLAELGPEPFDDLTLDRFKEIVSKSSAKIKALLMNQKKIGGVGNIYANEALFLADIDPRRPAKSLTQEEKVRLYKAILKVLKTGLRYYGTTEINFVDVLGQPGSYQKHLLVYGRQGQSCPKKCGGTIKKIRIGGRGTYFCPHCQK